MAEFKNDKVKNIIAVMSGKGGVGKSIITSLLASKYQKLGFKTGIMDADVTGPSIPKMFNLKEMLKAENDLMIPSTAKNGTKIISLNLLLENETEPVIWRGPVIANVIRQFWNEANWGELDYLFIDMPPGTGDVPLTVFQTIPVKGIVIVTSPQELVSMIVQKAINMANKMNVEVLGIIENMSYFKCPDCGKIHKIYGESHIEEIAKENKTKVLAQIPFDSEIAKYSDNGEIYNYSQDYLNKINF